MESRVGRLVIKMETYKVTKRFVLHVGYSCNERCEFCYYLDDLKKGRIKDGTTAQNKRKIAIAAAFGKTAIDISGGEPTIRPDLPELISYCREKGFRDITIITNGQRTADPAYCRTLKEAGLTEGLFSIHSHSAEIHDGFTHVPGSFERINRSVENFRAAGLQVRVNTVVNSENYKYLDQFFELVHKYQPRTVNLILFNPSETASKLSKDNAIRISDYQIIGDAVSAALDKWKEKIGIVNVRFLPFCFLRKHPDCIRTEWQKVHEDQEWDPILLVAFQKNWPAAIASTLAGFFTQWNVPAYRSGDFLTYLNKKLSGFRMKLYYRQGAPCRNCSLSPICTGLQRDYVGKFGFPDVEPFRLPGKVHDPLHFVKGLKDIFASLR